MRLIDADALANYANNQTVGITANDIMRFPTVDAEPVKHGRWVTGEDLVFAKCSSCQAKFYIDDLEQVGDANGIVHFCPLCGAEME